MKLLKWLFGSRKPALNKPVVMQSLPEYDYIVVEEGYPLAYHSYEEPLIHRWHFNGDKGICLKCNKIVERRLKGNVS